MLGQQLVKDFGHVLCVCYAQHVSYHRGLCFWSCGGLAHRVAWPLVWILEPLWSVPPECCFSHRQRNFSRHLPSETDCAGKPSFNRIHWLFTVLIDSLLTQEACPLMPFSGSIYWLKHLPSLVTNESWQISACLAKVVVLMPKCCKLL